MEKRKEDWLSDILCRAATGTGFSKRELYTDDDDIIYEYIRSVGLSAVHLPGTKPDLLDRSLILKLLFISKKFRRKYMADIIPKFEALKPQLLGYIFDILVEVLKRKAEGGIELEARSRMADWEEYCEIIARAMGYKDMEFIDVYADNIDLQTDLVIEDRPIAKAVIKLVEGLPEGQQWEGSTTDLLTKLNGIAIGMNIDTSGKERMWPKSASSLSYRLSEVKPSLRELGIEIYETQHSRTRMKTLHIYQSKEVGKTPLAPLAPFAPSKSEDVERENAPNANES